MTKCDFCTMSAPNGRCCWNFQASREDDCKKAIKQMVKALRKNEKKKKSLNRRLSR